jgi:hypothetical protein
LDYSVSVILRSRHKSTRPGLCELVVLLIEADDEHEATKAEALSSRYETEFQTANGDQVSWRFAGVQKVEAIDYTENRSGTELYSLHLTEEEARSILNPIADNE